MVHFLKYYTVCYRSFYFFSRLEVLKDGSFCLVAWSKPAGWSVGRDQSVGNHHFGCNGRRGVPPVVQPSGLGSGADVHTVHHHLHGCGGHSHLFENSAVAVVEHAAAAHKRRYFYPITRCCPFIPFSY